MNLSNHENNENLALSQTFQFLPNFRFLQKSQWQKFRSTPINAIYAKRIVPGLNRFLQWPFAKYPKYQNIFWLCCKLHYNNSKYIPYCC